ncbi:NAD-dependent deacylase [Paenibacillus senegalensis]|uniref:NAD-dependent deacylase n=1 Tax=Paenibacillus senegalensis TaxID=1465766 RepID=UPI000288191D|nr:NAD-dependent deacylase [Paenibacillus senegalensis]
MMTKWLKESKHTVVFTGAGMSTESGVPDFRSAQGLWQGKDPQQLASTEAMRHNPQQFVEFYRMRIKGLQAVTPHKGYECLSMWAKHLQLKSIITQNTDGLHEQAGNPNVIPLHGTIRQLHCQDCGLTYSTDRYLGSDAYRADRHFASDVYCACGGFIRPSVVLFGEPLDPRPFELAAKQALQADLFIVLGSSLVVSPANSFPAAAKEHGATLVIINRDPTPLDHLADEVIQDRNLGDVLQSITDELALA